ncbi:MAG: hypothetical protein KJ964_09910 [Verrucomicrobia bacterium]|nr:hypothetical protein [Verrucomicrobiota bacterium]MBU1734045.1 hypothetical protein [Verrucomicrobiota bacterium]
MQFRKDVALEQLAGFQSVICGEEAGKGKVVLSEDLLHVGAVKENDTAILGQRRLHQRHDHPCLVIPGRAKGQSGVRGIVGRG